MERHKEVTEHMQATHSEFARERDALRAKPKPLSGRDDARVSQAAAAANHIGRFQQTFHSEFDNFGYQNTLYSDAIEVCALSRSRSVGTLSLLPSQHLHCSRP